MRHLHRTHSTICAFGLTALASLWDSAAVAQTLVTGAGATFPYPIYAKWFSDYHKLHPDVQLNYQSIGSGGGIKQAIEGTVDFGASDGPMTDKQLAEFRQKRGCDLLHFPTVLGADVPTYNIPGLAAELNFTPAALAGIFLGHITKWDDAEIAAANPGVNLPKKDIVVIHRSDGSGTTFVWVDYLAKVNPEWKSKVGVGTSVNWPVGLGGKGNEGVSGLIRQTAYSIGYVELIYAVQNHLSYGKVRNRAGRLMKADLSSVTAAAAGAVKDFPEDFRVSITDALGAEAYPIASFTWLLVPSRIADVKKREILVGFLKWMLHDGQQMTKALSYAPLPAAVVIKEEKAIGLIKP